MNRAFAAAAGNTRNVARPTTIDERVGRGSRSLLGINEPQALLLRQAHEVLLHCALRHRLIPATDAAKTEAELARLRSLITAPPKGKEA